MKRMMGRKRKGGLVLLLAGVLAAAGVFLSVLHSFERRHPVARKFADALEEDLLLSDRREKTEEEIAGSVILNGKRYHYFHEFVSVLFIGTDGSGNESAAGEAYQGSMADFLLMLVLDKTEHTYGLLQLDRDTITKVVLLQKDGSDAASADMQLCTAHWYGGTKEQGSENTVRAVSDLMGGIPIDGYYTLNMDKIPTLNHAAGGVMVTLEEDFSDIDPAMKQGSTILLNDAQAYHYVHARSEVGDGTNISRMKRQRQYLEAFLQKIKQSMGNDPDLIHHLYQTLQADAVTDLSKNEILKTAEEIAAATAKGIYTFEGTSKIGQALGDGADHAEFYIKKRSVVDIMTQLYGLEESFGGKNK